MPRRAEGRRRAANRSGNVEFDGASPPEGLPVIRVNPLRNPPRGGFDRARERIPERFRVSTAPDRRAESATLTKRQVRLAAT